MTDNKPTSIKIGEQEIPVIIDPSLPPNSFYLINLYDPKYAALKKKILRDMQQYTRAYLANSASPSFTDMHTHPTITYSKRSGIAVFSGVVSSSEMIEGMMFAVVDGKEYVIREVDE